MTDYNFTEDEIKELFEISKLAFNMVMDNSIHNLSELDKYITNEISEDLWERLDI